jgi:hypothetical protein
MFCLGRKSLPSILALQYYQSTAFIIRTFSYCPAGKMHIHVRFFDVLAFIRLSMARENSFCFGLCFSPCLIFVLQCRILLSEVILKDI